MDIVTLFTAIISSSGLTAVISAWLNRRKNRLEIADKINQMASKWIDEQGQRIRELEKYVESCELRASERVEKLTVEVDHWKSDAAKRQQRNRLLVEQLNAYRQENRELKREVEQLRKKLQQLEGKITGNFT